MQNVVFAKPFNIRDRLAERGLEEGPLLDAIRQGYVAFISCTDNHPPFSKGLIAWAETVRALRDYLVPAGWRRSDQKNYSMVVEPAGRLAIVVATGDDGTGRSETTPSTKAPKGPSTIDAVVINRQLSLFVEPELVLSGELPSEDNDDRETWFLLVHRSQGQVRCELSLPLSMGPDGYINGWKERIILGPITLDGDVFDVNPPAVPDITIPIERRL